MIATRLFSVAFVLLLGAGAAGCQSSPEAVQDQQKKTVSSEQVAVVMAVPDFQLAMKEEGAQLIDVRTPGEVQQGYIAGAQKMDISDWNSFTEQVSKLDKNKPVLVYCAVGGRSGRAATYFEESGFTQIYDLKGGINAWKASSGELVK